jgi:signal transduction histidine kinase
MNALKYAGPCRINVRLSRDDDNICLEVRDTGNGFDLTDAGLFDTGGDGGFGLFNIRERLQGVGGRLDIDSEPGRGTAARVWLPVP